jgi:hypothetical protein
MRTVYHADGTQYLLCKESSESSLIRDPRSGEEKYVSNEELTIADTDDSPLVAAASGVPETVRTVLIASHGEDALGLLIELTDREGLSIVSMLDAYDYCESELNGQLAEFRAAGLITEIEIYGERGYGPTEMTKTAIESLRSISK